MIARIQTADAHVAAGSAGFLSASALRWCLAALLLSTGPRSVIHAADEQIDSLRIGYSLATLLAVNPSDAAAGTTVLVERLGNRIGQSSVVETSVYESLPQIIRDTENGRLDLISVLSHEYLEMADSLDLEPAFVPLRNGSVFEEILLIVRRDEASGGLPALAGKRLLISVSTTNDVEYVRPNVSALLSGGHDPSRIWLASRTVTSGGQNCRQESPPSWNIACAQ